MNWDELRKVAEAATPGPWDVCESPEWHENDLPDQVICGEDHVSVALLSDEWYEDEDGEPASADDARHIATFAPPTVLRLLGLAERAEAAEAALERVRALADWCEREEAQLVVWYGHEQCVSHNAAMKIRAALDPAPASEEGPVVEGRCNCGHGEHVHDPEEVPPVCVVCGDDTNCNLPPRRCLSCGEWMVHTPSDGWWCDVCSDDAALDPKEPQ